MDHPLESVPAHHLPQGFWRTAAVVAILVATVELALLVVTGTALLVRHGGDTGAAAHKTAKTKAKPAATVKPMIRRHTVAAPKLARGKVSVMVLNGNGLQGAAAGAAARVRHHGYPVRSVGNARRMSYAHSIVMYRPGYEGEGRRLARDLGIGRVGPLDGMRPSQLHGAKAVLILGA